MAWQDRPYAQEDDGGRVYRGPGMSGMSVTTMLIIANAVVFFLTAFRTPVQNLLLSLGVMQAEAVLHGQLWRLFTATYLHANLGHIFFNMLGLYFFGPALERIWGGKQYFFVYTLGGIVGNIILTLAGLVGFIDPRVLGVGASGSVLTLLGAAAVLFPNAQVYIYFILPMRIRTFVLLYAGWFIYNVLTQGDNFGGDICHLGGLLVGVLWAITGGISLSGRHHTHMDPNSLLGKLFGGGAGGRGNWQRNIDRRRADDAEVDRILAKVHTEGIESLTARERATLSEASRRRNDEEGGDFRDGL